MTSVTRREKDRRPVVSDTYEVGTPDTRSRPGSCVTLESFVPTFLSFLGPSSVPTTTLRTTREETQEGVGGREKGGKETPDCFL